MQKAFLSSGWHSPAQLDGWLSQALRSEFNDGLELHFGQETKLSIGACVRLLSYLHELDAADVPVSLRGLSDWGLGAYLARIGFLELSPARVDVEITHGAPPSQRGQNPSLEEIVAIAPGKLRDAELPGRLSDKVAECASNDMRDSLRQAAYTYFAELIDNVGRHSGSARSGYAALQVYAPSQGARRMVEVAVSDSGAGILATLRPAVAEHYPTLARLSDENLLLYAVNNGVSRHGDEAGCGIAQSAKGVLRWPEPTLDLRQPKIRLGFSPGATGGYVVTEVRRSSALFLLPGTHWVARYALD